MLRKAKLSTKIGAIAAALLVFTGVVALVGYRGAATVVNHVSVAEDVNGIVTLLSRARQEEKNFIITGDDRSKAKLAEHMDALDRQIQKARAQLASAENLSLREANRRLNLVPDETFARLTRPAAMTGPP